MRGKSSPKQGSKGVMDTNKQDKIKEAPHLSGAYIRSLVKQLTSTRTKDPLSSEDQENLDAEGLSRNHQDSSRNNVGGRDENEDSHPSHQHQQPPPQQHKKQVRRRLHTSRPYQERLLNMAEARREIVTALKFHRAAMKQAHEQKQQEQQHQIQTPEGEYLQESHQLDQEGRSKFRRNQRIYASSLNNNFNSYVDNFSHSAYSCPPPPNYTSYPWSLPPVATPMLPENFNLALPNQPLGLNLNFQDFNLDSSFVSNLNNSSVFSSIPSPSSSSSPPLSFPIEEVPTVGFTQDILPSVNYDDDSTIFNSDDLGLHHAMDDKEMAEIRSIGEQHQIEWNDTMNLMTSAWWFKFLKNMEIQPQENGEDYGKFPFDEIMDMEFPSWLNSNENLLEEEFLGDYCSDEYMQDSALPCMEIEEIEGMDEEWLSS